MDDKSLEKYFTAIKQDSNRTEEKIDKLDEKVDKLDKKIDQVGDSVEQIARTTAIVLEIVQTNNKECKK